MESSYDEIDISAQLTISAVALRRVLLPEVEYHFKNLTVDQTDLVYDLVKNMHDLTDFHEFTREHWIDSFIDFDVKMKGEAILQISGNFIYDDAQKALGFEIKNIGDSGRLIFSTKERKSGKSLYWFAFRAVSATG